ncbi:MAG: hypothetical protein ACKVQU_29205 [Burkholderiales bacterium]
MDTGAAEPEPSQRSSAHGPWPAERKATCVFEAIDRHYKKIGLKRVAMPMTLDGRYQIILKRTPDRLAAFDAAPSFAAYAR